MRQKESKIQYIPKSFEYLTKSKKIIYKDRNLKTDYLINIISDLITKYWQKYELDFNLSSMILKQKYGKHYNFYIEWLVDHGVIKLISNYYSGKKARTYKLTINFDYIIKCKIYDKIIIQKIIKRMSMDMANSPIPEDIRRILVDDLNYIKIDYDGALNYLQNEYDSERIGEAKYNKNKHSIFNINDKERLLTFDRYGRMHTNFTNLKKEIRKDFLSIDGEDQLAEVDVINSQPLFFAKILEDEIDDEHLNNEVKRFIELTKTGLIYDDFAKYSELTRKEVKLLFCKVLFGFNNGSKEDAIFKNIYPTIYEYIKEYKSMDNSYKEFSHRLQRMESNFIFDIVVRLLKEKHPHIRIFTVHDSICFPEKYKTEVNLIFNNCFREYFNSF